ncbi:hypothetical protein [Streptomyces sp. NPDC004296]|uniref:hypothetical protein n=1 Tax=Streptomyces sp. NPDC004296 TaxID=3364697 RepID=UPI00369D2DA7
MFTSGVGFLACFGFGWWVLGTSAFDGPIRLISIAVGCLAPVVLMLAARRLLPATGGGAFPADRRRRFRQVNVVQWLLIVAVVVGCLRTGVPVLVGPLVAVVVGLHFLPLAAVFALPRLRVPAALLVAAGAAGGAVWCAGGPDATVRLVVGLMCALSLWGVAAWTLAAASAAGRAVAE